MAKWINAIKLLEAEGPRGWQRESGTRTVGAQCWQIDLFNN